MTSNHDPTPEHEQAATAALEWLRRQSDRLGTIATRHGLDPFNYGYLHAVDATAHMLGQLLHATRLATAPAPRDPEKGTVTEALEFLAAGLESTVDTDDEAAVSALLATVIGVYQLRITQGRGMSLA